MADDVRTRVTKQLLKEALKNEIEKKTIDRITVRAICEAAHVSRPTFYTYYQDIFELYLDCERDLIGELGLPQNMEKLFSPDESEQIILRILDHVDHNDRIYKTFFQKYNPYIARNVLGPIIRDVSRTLAGTGRFASSEEADIFILYHTSGLMVSIGRWLSEDRRRRMDKKTYAAVLAGFVSLDKEGVIKRKTQAGSSVREHSCPRSGLVP